MRAIIIYVVRFFFFGPFLFIYHLFHIYIFWNKTPKSKFCKLQPRTIKTEKKPIKFMIFFFFLPIVTYFTPGFMEQQFSPINLTLTVCNEQVSSKEFLNIQTTERFTLKRVRDMRRT